ncbi:MAG: hypothetical protein PHO67_07735 [Candidatus Omnitrophica bacterium]|nr:hypothetical protein [Candidatus Omnitrophota bacterium]
MEKKKAIALTAVGVGSALGLGWLMSRLIKPDEGEGEETPELSVNMYWD